MSRKFLVSLVLGLVVTGAVAGSAWATITGVTATAAVTEAHKVGACNQITNQQQIDGTVDLKIENKTGAPITLVSANWGLFANNDLTGPINGTVLVTGTGLANLPGAVIANNADLTLNGLNFTALLPCDTQQAYLCVQVAVLNQQATSDSCSAIISGGNAVPNGTLGLIGLSALLGLALVATPVVRRHQRKRRDGVPAGA